MFCLYFLYNLFISIVNKKNLIPNPVYSPHTSVRLFLAIMEQLRSNEQDYALFTPLNGMERMYKKLWASHADQQKFSRTLPKNL